MYNYINTWWTMLGSIQERNFGHNLPAVHALLNSMRLSASVVSAKLLQLASQLTVYQVPPKPALLSSLLQELVQLLSHTRNSRDIAGDQISQHHTLPHKADPKASPSLLTKLKKGLKNDLPDINFLPQRPPTQGHSHSPAETNFLVLYARSNARKSGSWICQPQLCADKLACLPSKQHAKRMLAQARSLEGALHAPPPTLP